MRYTHTKQLLVTPPPIEPVSLSEAKRHCRIPDAFTDDDSTIASLITSARQLLEEECWSAFITQTWDFWWDRFWWKLFVPHCPLQQVVKFQYVSNASPWPQIDIPTSVWELSATNNLSYARLKYLQTWPLTRGYRDDVYMRVTLGYGDAPGDVPMPIRHAIKLLVGDGYNNRENSVVGVVSTKISHGVDALVAPYRLNEA